jgi:putative phosphoesterase
MKIGVLSDSHGYRTNMLKAIDQLIHLHHVDLLVHLGDDFDDALDLDRFDTELVKVPGVFSSYYRDPHIPNRVLKGFEGWRTLLSHTDTSHENDLPTDPIPEQLSKDGQVDLILFGHSHIPTLDERDGVIRINPGHLKNKDKKGYSPTFGLVEIHGGRLIASIIDLASGKTLEAREFTKRTKIGE